MLKFCTTQPIKTWRGSGFCLAIVANYCGQSPHWTAGQHLEVRSHRLCCRIDTDRCVPRLHYRRSFWRAPTNNGDVLRFSGFIAAKLTPRNGRSGRRLHWPDQQRRTASELPLKPFPCQSRWIQVPKRRRKPMLRKSLIAFTAATVICAGSQAVAAGFRHAMSTPRTPFPRSEEKVSPISPHAEIPIAKLDRKDLLGKKMYDHQGNFLGKVVSVIKDDAGEIVSVQLRATVTREARVPANQVNIKPDGGTLTLAESNKGLQWNYIGPRNP